MSNTKEFQETVWDFYTKHGRHDLPWRQPEQDGSFDPYKIMVSEVMLQQTQVVRVIPKYLAFIGRFPNVQSLAKASFAQVLEMWSGLGYNRRAKFLLEAAQKLDTSQTPHTPEGFAQLPGIGPNTAAAICVYSYNQQLIFIETNIRSVFIHHFFQDREDLTDKEILPLVEATLPQEGKEQTKQRIHSAAGAMRKAVGLSHNREWYWALMDYGSYIKRIHPNPSRRSKHHVVQSRFEGSRRQLRAKVLRMLLKQAASKAMLEKELHDERLHGVLADLEKEGLIINKNKRYRLAET